MHSIRLLPFQVPKSLDFQGPPLPVAWPSKCTCPRHINNRCISIVIQYNGWLTCEDRGEAEAADGVDGLLGEAEYAGPAGEVPQEPVDKPGHNVHATNDRHQVRSVSNR